MLPNLSEYHTIGFSGSREIPAGATGDIAAIVSHVLESSSCHLAVGCSVGADELVIKAISPSHLHRLSIFAAFGPDGTGSGMYSATETVKNAREHGASITWWAGGGLEIPIHQRLALRSVHICRFLAANQPAALICFPSSPESKGTLLTIRRAQSSRISIFVKCIGFPASLPPPLKHITWIE